MSKKILIHLIAAARPNFMKIAPLYHALKKEDWADVKIVHTGQHYDLNMSDVFFRDLELPEPHLHLGVGSGSHAEQTGNVMMAYEKVLNETHPDLVVVVGDVNSTMACTIAASKITYHPTNSTNPINQTPRPLVAHLEAGLRSFDRSMPEEVNRMVTDALADILWTPSPDGDAHLLKEGVPKEKIDRVGNIMIDSLLMLRRKIEALQIYKEYGLKKNAYGLITLHRPANVDNSDQLESLCRLLIRISDRFPLIFPVHPRTRKNLDTHGFTYELDNKKEIILLSPQSYNRFMSLVMNCRFALTDSGGIQEETSYLNIPCFTLRPNTERPITISEGTNKLCTIDSVEDEIEKIGLNENIPACTIARWDGKTSQRVVKTIKRQFGLTV